MRRILFLLMMIVAVGWSQNTTFTLPLRSKTTGKLVPGKTLALYQSGIKKYDLTETSPGVYTNSNVATGKYDVYVDGNPLTGWQGVWHGADKLTKIEGNANASGEMLTSGIADLAVTNGKIAGSAVTNGKIAGSAVTTAKIQNGAITNDKLATAAVAQANLQDSIVTNQKLGTLSVDSINFMTGAKQYIQNYGGAATITNNPDGVTIISNANSKLEVKDHGIDTNKVDAGFKAWVNTSILSNDNTWTGTNSYKDIRLYLPDTVYASTNYEANIYYDNITMVPLYQMYDYNVTCDSGLSYSSRWTWIPIGNIGQILPWHVDIYDMNNVIVDSGSTIIKVVDGAKLTTAKSILIIGDSETEMQTWVDTLASVAGANLSFIGTLGTTHLHEGLSGKTYHYFATDPASPFLNGGVLDFRNYLTVNSLADPNFVIFQLGANDSHKKESVADNYVDADSLFEAVHRDLPAAHIGATIPIPTARQQNAFGIWYANGKTYWEYKENLYAFNQSILGKYRVGGTHTYSYVKLIPFFTNMDAEHNFPEVGRKYNARNSTTVQVQGNAAHPASSGFAQMADVCYAWMQSYPYSTEAANYFARMTTQPSSARKTLIDNLISTLVTDGIWAKLDLFYLFASHDQQSGNLNAVANNYTITTSGTITFTIDRGYQGDGTSGYLNVNYTPSTDATNYAQNSATVGIYVRQGPAEGAYSIDADDGTRALSAVTRTLSSDGFGGYINDRTWVAQSIYSNIGLGTYEIKRGSSTTKYLLHVGSVAKTATVTSTGLPTVPIIIGKQGSTYSTNEFSIFYLGSYLTDTQSTQMQAAIETYLDAIGAGVIP